MKLKKILFIIGGTALGLVTVTLVGLFFLFLSWPSQKVQIGDDIEKYTQVYIEKHKLIDVEEKLLCYYDFSETLNSTSCALLTDHRVIMHVDFKSYFINLTDIVKITHYVDDYKGDIIQVIPRKGSPISVEIPPRRMGSVFLRELQREFNKKKSPTS